MISKKIDIIMSSNEIMAHNILYELWYSVAETIFQRVCSITELDEEQMDALRKAALRPNDFQIQVDNT
jgi:heme-binding NEAT domain protein